MSTVQHAIGAEPASVKDANHIPPLSHPEASEMNAEELSRFIALIESLQDADWNLPTACTLWTVKDVVAHQAAHVVSFISLRQFLAQQSPALLRPYRKRGLSQLDAWNQSQVDLRRNRTGEELVAEIRTHADAALRGHDSLPGLIRSLTLPLPGFDQPRSFGYLFDLIYCRDMWMHRHDICAATSRQMPLDATYDGRVVALVVRDFAEKFARAYPGRSARLRLTGPAGADYDLGAAGEPSATVEIDAMVFCVLTSGRVTAADTIDSQDVRLSGDVPFARETVNFSENRVMY